MNLEDIIVIDKEAKKNPPISLDKQMMQIRLKDVNKQ